MGRQLKLGRIFEGEVCVVVATGPSLTLTDVRLIGMAHERGKTRVIAVNDAVYPCWFADIHYACDAKWWRYHGHLRGFIGIKARIFFEENGKDKNHVDFDDVHYLKAAGKDGLELDPEKVAKGGSSGYQALNFAVNLGAAKVILVGFDMRGGRFFGDHPADIEQLPTVKTEDMASRFDSMVKPLKKLGVRVVNATPNSAITAFERVDLHRELSRLI